MITLPSDIPKCNHIYFQKLLKDKEGHLIDTTKN
jgi:hypothetical protein